MISFKSVPYPNFPSSAINTQLLCCCERLARWELENKVTQDTIKGFLKPCHNPCDCPSLDGEWRHFNVYKDCLIIDDWLSGAARVSWLSWLSWPPHGRQAEKAESDGPAACSLYRRDGPAACVVSTDAQQSQRMTISVTDTFTSCYW